MREVGDAGDLLGLGIEHLDEDAADGLALHLGILDPGERVEELLPRVDGPKAIAEPAAERLGDALRLPCPEYAVVDEHARQLVADGAVDDRRGDGGIDAAREGANHLLVADLIPDLLDLLADEVLHRPVGLGLAEAEDEAPSTSVPRSL